MKLSHGRARTTRPHNGRLKVLVVNCYFPEIREAVKLTHEVPNALAPVFLGGVLSPERCEIRLHNEVSDGFLEVFAPELTGWPDVLVLSGLTATFDRFLHLTAYARTANPRVMVVAGGPAVRALPRHSRKFFDHSTTGDVEELADVIRDEFGAEYVADEAIPRYDLAPWIGKRIAYVESSRNCNFRCSFCSLTADGYGYAKKSAGYLRRQIDSLGRRQLLFFQDNQFHGADDDFFRERIALIKEMRAEGRFDYWSGFFTDAFFWRDDNIQLLKESGCFSVFVGVESFNQNWLKSVNKQQNVRESQVALIEKCMDAGILFQYGLVFDPTQRSLADMHREIDFICSQPEVPLPNFIFMAIPFPGTPFFRQRAEEGLLLPNTKVRDLEGSTLSMRPLDPIDQVADFLRGAKNFSGYKRKAIRHQRWLLKRYRGRLSRLQGLASTVTMTSILSPTMVSNPRYALRRRRSRTHVSSTDRLDTVYTPRLPVDSRYESYFQPTAITDSGGAIVEDLRDDLFDTRYARTRAV